MTFEVQQTRWDRIIRRVSGSVGPGSRVSETLSELFPVLDVENVPIELLRLGGYRVAMGGGFLAGVAAEGVTAQLFNPADSGVLAVLTTVYVAFESATGVRWGVTQTQVGTVIATQVFRDTRDVLPDLPTCQVSQRSDAALASATMQTRIAADTNFTLNDQNGITVLAPGTGFEIGNGTLNLNMNYGFVWRERPVEPSELQF